MNEKSVKWLPMYVFINQMFNWWINYRFSSTFMYRVVLYLTHHHILKALCMIVSQKHILKVCSKLCRQTNVVRQYCFRHFFSALYPWIINMLFFVNTINLMAWEKYTSIFYLCYLDSTFYFRQPPLHFWRNCRSFYYLMSNTLS